MIAGENLSTISCSIKVRFVPSASRHLLLAQTSSVVSSSSSSTCDADTVSPLRTSNDVFGRAASSVLYLEALLALSSS